MTNLDVDVFKDALGMMLTLALKLQRASGKCLPPILMGMTCLCGSPFFLGKDSSFQPLVDVALK
jgi:hypothetical protein